MHWHRSVYIVLSRNQAFFILLRTPCTWFRIVWYFFLASANLHWSVNAKDWCFFSSNCFISSSFALNQSLFCLFFLCQGPLLLWVGWSLVVTTFPQSSCCRCNVESFVQFATTVVCSDGSPMSTDQLHWTLILHGREERGHYNPTKSSVNTSLWFLIVDFLQRWNAKGANVEEKMCPHDRRGVVYPRASPGSHLSRTT